MAIIRSAGTEIIRSVHLEACNSTDRFIIVGEQHHIYTVLSITVMATDIQAAGNYARCYILGYDSVAGGSAATERMYIFWQDMNHLQTFVWNDKFSFNGFGPADFVGPMDDATKQNAIADQGGSVQSLKIHCEHASDGFDVNCTYIDQNNA